MPAPPSYESVVADLQSQVGPNPTAKDYIALANALPSYKKDVLTTGAAAAPQLKLTLDQQAAVHHGMAKALQTDEALEALKSGARLAVTACKAIEQQFANLLLDLGKIDAKNQPPTEGAFGPRLETFRQEFRKTLTDSKDLALRIAVYGQDFDESIIPLCADASLSFEERKKQIAIFIANATEFEKSTQDIKDRFDNLSSKFTLFVASFSGWAASRETQLNADLKAAQDKLTSLKTDLENLTIASYVMIGIETAGGLAIGAAFFCGPAVGPLVALGGLITAGLAAVGGMGCVIGMAIVQSQIDSEMERITKLQGEISDITTTRATLEHTGNEHLTKFKTHISAIEAVWTRAHKDATLIEEWLKKAEEKAEISKPSYMEGQLRHGVSIYSKMAIYLEEYATGLVNAKLSDL